MDTMNNCGCLNFANLDAEGFAKSFCTFPGVENYLLNYKLPQTVTVVPAFSTQTRAAQGKNRFIQSVLVTPISPSIINVSLAVGAEMTFTSPYTKAGTSADVAIATVAVVGTTATITGVAAGTTTITLTDGKNTVSTITVTVA
jgi:uncharacterized protein YjdB